MIDDTTLPATGGSINPSGVAIRGPRYGAVVLGGEPLSPADAAVRAALETVAEVIRSLADRSWRRARLVARYAGVSSDKDVAFELEDGTELRPEVGFERTRVIEQLQRHYRDHGCVVPGGLVTGRTRSRRTTARPRLDRPRHRGRGLPSWWWPTPDDRRYSPSSRWTSSAPSTASPARNASGVPVKHTAADR